MSPFAPVNRPRLRILQANVESLTVPLNLDHLLERRPVLPRDQRLRDRAERAEVDRVEAGLIAVTAGRLAHGIAALELRRGDLQRRAQGGAQREPAASQVSAAAPPATAIRA